MLGHKDDIRRAARARRRELSAAQRRDLGHRIGSHLLSVVPPNTPRIAIYASVGSEVPTSGLFAQLTARGCQVLYPRCVAGHSLELARVRDLSEMRPGPLGIPEPVGPAVPWAQVPVVVIPGLAFDAAGTRLGAGAGYYDRSLAGYRGLRLGLAFDCQRVPRLPMAAHDQAVDAVITESGVWWVEAAPAAVPVGGHAWSS